MYYRELETDPKAMQEHNANQKANAAERLKRNATYNAARKGKSK